MQSSTAFAVLRPEMQTPRLIVRQHSNDSINDPVSPRIDRSSLNFGSIRQRLTRKGEQQAIEVCFRRDSKTFDFVHNRLRCSTPYFIREKRSCVGIYEKKMHARLEQSRFGRLHRRGFLEG